MSSCVTACAASSEGGCLPLSFEFWVVHVIIAARAKTHTARRGLNAFKLTYAKCVVVAKTQQTMPCSSCVAKLSLKQQQQRGESLESCSSRPVRTRNFKFPLCKNPGTGRKDRSRADDCELERGGGFELCMLRVVSRSRARGSLRRVYYIHWIDHLTQQRVCHTRYIHADRPIP